MEGTFLLLSQVDLSSELIPAVHYRTSEPSTSRPTTNRLLDGQGSYIMLDTVGVADVMQRVRVDDINLETLSGRTGLRVSTDDDARGVGRRDQPCCLRQVPLFIIGKGIPK